MSEMMYGQIMVHSDYSADIGETVTFTDELGNTSTGTIANDGFCRKKLPAFKNYVVTFKNVNSIPIIMGCGENHYFDMGTVQHQITLYSAKGDIVSYTDIHGNTQLIAFDENSTSKVVDIAINPESTSEFIFTSSVAKDPSDLTKSYSKTVSISSDVTEVYVMPENSLYWYGYKADETITNNSYVTYNTNDMTLDGNGWNDVTWEHVLSGTFSKTNFIFRTSTVRTGSGLIYRFDGGTSYDGSLSVIKYIYNSAYTSLGTYNGGTSTGNNFIVNAIWLE